MAAVSRRSILRLFRVFLVFPLALACSDNGTGPIKELAPFVGVWEAQSLTLADPDNPAQNIDMVDRGASYALSVLSTGQYTAVFNLIVAQGHQSGTITLSGDKVTLTPTIPPGAATSGTWAFQGEMLIVDAVTLVDYDEDGEDEAIAIRFEFLPRED